MPEPGEIARYTERPLLSPQFLKSLARDPKFASNIALMSRQAQQPESAFVVRNVSGTPEIYDLVRTPKYGGLVKDPNPSVSFRTLIREQKGNSPKILKGIVLMCHSHPVRTGQRPEDMLRPSEPDLENWENHRLETKNPYLIYSIVVKKGNDALMLLIQADPARPQQPSYQQWDEELDSVGKLYELLRESGYRLEIIRVNLKTKQVLEEDVNKLLSFSVSEPDLPSI